MPFPRWVARFNKRYTNRFLEPVVRRSSGFAVVHHVGRTSGRAYTTPVNVFECADRFVIALTYGPTADWVRNVEAGPASIELGGTTNKIDAHEIVGRPEVWTCLPAFVRLALRILTVRHFCRLSVSQVNTSL